MSSRHATAPARPARASRLSIISQARARSCSSTCSRSPPMRRTRGNAHLIHQLSAATRDRRQEFRARALRDRECGRLPAARPGGAQRPVRLSDWGRDGALAPQYRSQPGLYPRAQSHVDPFQDRHVSSTPSATQGYVRLEHVSKRFERIERGRRRVARHRARRDLLPAGSIRLRQDHTAAPARRLRDPERRAPAARRAGLDRDAAVSSGPST